MGAIASALGVLAAIVIGAWQAFYPCIYRGVKSAPAGSGARVGEEFCAGSLVEVNGPNVMIVLAVPVLIGFGGYLAVRTNRRVPAWIAVILLFIFCLLGAASVGIFYLPSFLLLAVAAATLNKPTPTGD